MLTPSFNLTATERVLPKLALDFTTASLDARVTVTRTTNATNPATYVNSSGLVALATNNQPRFDYNPITLACRGLLIEESRANMLLQSADLTSASWNKTIDGGVTIGSNAINAPDGTLTADKVIPSVTSGFHCVNQAVITTAATHTVSYFAKAGGYSYLQIFDSLSTDYVNFDLINGTVGSASTYVGSIEAFPDGWYRCRAVNAFGAATNGIRAGVVTAANAPRGQAFSGNASDGIYLWGAQLELGAFPTSYIPTTTTSLTRNADVVTMTGTNFTDWYNASEGTLVSTAYRQSLGDIPTFVCIDDGTASNKIEFISYSNYDAEAQVFTLGSQQANPYTAGNVYPVNTQRTIAFGYKVNSFYGAFNGAAMPNANPDTTGTIPTVTQLQFGRRAALVEGAVTISTFRYYSLRLTNAEIVAISKG